MKNGVDIDYAMALDPEEAMAHAIVFREMETGERYDFENGSWVEP